MKSIMLANPLADYLPALILPLLVTTGCVSRSYTIETEPKKAMVFVSGKLIGNSPVKRSFTFYGTREVVIRKEGYLPKIAEMENRPPLYQRFPIDMVPELIYPLEIRDDQVFTYKLEPLSEQPAETQERLKERAQAGRAQLSTVPLKEYQRGDKKRKSGHGTFPYPARRRHWWHRR